MEKVYVPGCVRMSMKGSIVPPRKIEPKRVLGVPDEVHERVTGWRPLTDVVEAKRSTITPAGCTSTSSTTWKPVALVAMARKVTGKRFGRKVSLPERARGAGLYAMRSCWKLPPS